MALQNKNLGVVNVNIAAVKSIESTHNKVVEFAIGAAVLELPVGTAMAFNEDSDTWAVWDPTAAAVVGDGFLGVIRGFVYPDPVTVDDTLTVLGVLMFSGRIGYADIVQDTAINPGFTAAKLKAAIVGDWAAVDAAVATYAGLGNANSLRSLGIIVEDVPLIAR